ncbi:acetyl-CoA carboxylase biotin carboxylase subunit [Reichenbachiella carrageenanivorans]|uniref:Acetyl-CoA carboxylase biotin carboxylase subunit n=1 Tax=Reichenbachiella carrageenanivorans TaxID=2979869 RepID=A0ABY6CY48_9BACT|nr:acetyl-CoA carboxylase biotin carboxylase subunit [Reichenbachiella carrageenanivorans]UXX78832.1 acetyl-CoA carboxylase biotin carboxylase subunit [Reichenbachiella carrageenanivorans]
MKNIKKVLIANRGEIAIRVIRSAREMGITTVAVFSEADRLAPHVKLADEAICIGPAASAESYLVIDNIIKVCTALHVDAVHPGYGFLSENAEFARRLKKAGVILIGPSAKSMEVMGDKLAAKKAVATYDIPMVPGINEAIEDLALAKKVADEIGYPVLIKASAGGGGKGMRVVEDADGLEEGMTRAISEAKSAFGDGSVFIEKYIASPRHIEVQVLGDEHGNILHLFERECSIQRRHQKVIEEAPSSIFSEAKRKAIGETAIKVAKACDYVGAGTVEFIVDENHDFFFLEMNTRLQVEHCVTEEITGIDLVKEQIKIAQGEKISFSQDDLKINGHALEVRIYAENPKTNFLPDIGKLLTYKRPHGPGVRVDDGYEEGMDIPIYYDPMIGKLITKGATRKEAIDRMTRAIDEFQINGIETTLSFCRFAINHEAFVSGHFDTKFVDTHFKPEFLDAGTVEEEQVAAIMAVMALGENRGRVMKSNEPSKVWKSRSSYR